jgi:hypothetical protein
MPYAVHQTSAENIIGATDAAVQKPEGVDSQLVATFLDTALPYARDTLLMACEIGLLTQPQTDLFKVGSQCAIYVTTASKEAKAAILRFVLEQYEPYKTFKARLGINGVLGEAANQTRALHNIDAHRQIIMDTFSDLGTYAQSLVSEGGGLYRPREDHPQAYLQILDDVIQDRETAVIAVRRRLGEEAAAWVHPQDVLDHLVTAFQRAAQAGQDSRAPIVHAANAVESFLAQLAAHHGVNVANAPGLNAKADTLATANHLTTKHKFMLKYLGHVRNAADHGVDAEIGRQWDVSENTSVEYVHVAITTIKCLVAQLNNRFTV